MPICKTQVNSVLSKIKHINPKIGETRFFGFLKKTENEIFTPKNIYRKNQFGLALEQIDFFEGSSEIQRHIREFIPRKEKSVKKTTVEFFLDNSKKIIKERFNFKQGKTEIEKETTTRNCLPGRKLVSETKEILGKDDVGEFKQIIIKTLDPETHKPTSVQNEKIYIDKEGHALENFKKVTTLVDEKGKKYYQKVETPTGWKSCEFDKNKNPFNQDSGFYHPSYDDYSENLI